MALHLAFGGSEFRWLPDSWRRQEKPSVPGPEPLRAADGASERTAEASALGRRYRAYQQQYRDLTPAALQRELGVKVTPDGPLSFDPTQSAYYPRIAEELQLTSEEAQVFQREGMVSVDHEQRYSMGSAYFAIYARDLPVLITADSLLHALHRSYDQVLKELEVGRFTTTLRSVLKGMHERLAQRASELGGAPLSASADDVDLYLTVARSLLAGAGEPGKSREGQVDSARDQDDAVAAVLDAIASLRLENPATGSAPTRLRGGTRPIDYSQFRPRGHYTESSELQSYFRSLMWLGRADVGFLLTPPSPEQGIDANVRREQLGALLLALLIRDSGQQPKLQVLSDAVDFLVGRSDDVNPALVSAGLDAAGVSSMAALKDGAKVEQALAHVAARSLATQQIRSQVLLAPRARPAQAPPQVFQLFGQRFSLDSFVLSRVVYDSIEFQGAKPERMLPTGLDVMAALGNDEAVRILTPELERHHYAANLLALRRSIEAEPPQRWQQDVYTQWLDALRTLDDAAPSETLFPQVMRRTAWRRKQLQTQLASWAELRHDTILYAKQSYTSVPSCGYPTGYVEPYPELYARLGRLAREAARGQAALGKALGWPGEQQQAFFENFASVMQQLELLSRKELRGEPFADSEHAFLERAITRKGHGSGLPSYDGWYADLIYRPDYQSKFGEYEKFGPSAWKPTIADVHSSAGSDREPARVLEVGVGDVELLVVAIDNGADIGAYVGPVYTYYELDVPPQERMTDEQWQARIQADRLPPRPSFLDLIRAKPLRRTPGLNGSPMLERAAE